MNLTNDEQGTETKKTICWASPGCSSSCGILVSLKDGKITNMRGNPEFPGSQGAVCNQRFPHLLKWLEHHDQLMYPLKRQGERGENKWERIDRRIFLQSYKHGIGLLSVNGQVNQIMRPVLSKKIQPKLRQQFLRNLRVGKS